ncbi:MAG: hypothetical protein BWY11_01059 [Firmicutes bacterium ADurb.Bin182]|nr:MAG: hypothetical protein BWY11_01059 [Firmicutes bacterium ADurb.Bin182]
MKATDYRREHFEKGMNFSQTDFDAYINASANATKAVFTRFLPCVLGGLLISQVFAIGIGGVAGNLLAIVFIFIGLITGSGSIKRTGEKVEYYSKKLGITKKDIVAARNHIKNGTVAWRETEMQ